MSVETTAPSTVTRPMTGEEYLESIREPPPRAQAPSADRPRVG